MLTPEEQAELRKLEAMAPAKSAARQAKGGGLTPQEQEELRQLESMAPATERKTGIKSPEEVQEFLKKTGEQAHQYKEGDMAAFGMGMADELSLGYAPQVGSAIGALVGQDGTYTQRRDEIDRSMRQAEERNPGAYRGGEAVGALGSILALGGAGAAAQGFSKLPLAGKMVQGAKVGARGGALYGLLSNPGETEGEISPFQPVERARNAAIGGLGGAVFGAAGPAAMPLAKKAGKGLSFAKDFAGEAFKSGARAFERSTIPTKVTAKAQEIVDFLAKKGVIGSVDEVPEDLIFGKHSDINKMALRLADGTRGQPIKEARIKFARSLDDSIDREIQEVGGGTIKDPFQAGQEIGKLWNKNVDEFFKSMDVTYSAIRQEIPDLRLSDDQVRRLHWKLLSTERNAEKMLKGFGSDPAMARETLKMVQAIRSAWQSENQLGDVVEVMQNIGRAAFKRQEPALGTPPVDNKQAQKLYHAVKDIVVDRVGEYDRELWKRLLYNNSRFEKFFQEQKGIHQYFLKEPAPEKIFINLIQNGDSKTVSQIRRMLQGEYSKPIDALKKGQLDLELPKKMDPLASIKGAYLESLIKRRKDGGIDYMGTINHINGQRKRPAFNEIFRGDEKSVEDFFKLLRVGAELGEKSLNPSGTETTRRFGQFFRDVRNSIQDEALLETLKSRAYDRSGGPVKMNWPPIPGQKVPPKIPFRPKRGKP